MSNTGLKLPADIDIAKAIVAIHNFNVADRSNEFLSKHYLSYHISTLDRHITLAKQYKRKGEVAFYKYLKKYIEVSSNNHSSSLYLALLDEINLQRIDTIL